MEVILHYGYINCNFTFCDKENCAFHESKRSTAAGNLLLKAEGTHDDKDDKKTDNLNTAKAVSNS